VTSPAADPAAAVSEARLRADVEALAGFGTRHTLSEQDSPTRGIGAARRWGEAQFRAIAAGCDGCLEVALPERMVSGPRVPTPTRLVNVVAIQRGAERPDEVVIVQGHIDSRVSDVMDAASDAPGANDNASGTALVIEAARLLSQRRYPGTIVYALLSGEEQGLHGGELLADYAAEQGWRVKAVLNNDIVGGSCGSDRLCDDEHVRVFSEGPRADLDEQTRAAQSRNGGENDTPGRNLSRWIDAVAEEAPGGLDVRQIWRTDRMGRGGDQIPFLRKGYPAVRFSVAVEDYEHQHQDLRTEGGITYGDTIEEMDFPYLAKVTQLNIRALDRLARAPMPPAPAAKAAVQTFTALSWQEVPGATRYHIYRRATDEGGWPAEPELAVPADAMPVAADAASATLVEGANSPVISASGGAFSVELPGVRGDDWVFGVSSVSAEGVESPVASAVPGGAFAPLVSE